ncbi:UDP-N-acetyl-alpha-D-glucosamine C6 dehydratase [Campylobacterota bacterium]|nr:UDP-N-acetyl-alpha-D-glucosamine C6 dehydratase [Campylobacterota bacterium]
MSPNLKRTLFFLVFDAVLSLISFLAAYLLRFNFLIPEDAFASLWYFLATLYALKVAAFAVVGVYSIPWRFFSLSGVASLTQAHFVAYGLFAVLYVVVEPLANLPLFPRSVLVIDLCISLILLAALRASKRLFVQYKSKSKPIAVIIGSDENAEKVFRTISDMQVIAFVAIEKSSRGLRIHGKRVIDFRTLIRIAAKSAISCAIIAPNKHANIVRIYETLRHIGIREIRKVELGDTLGLAPLKIEDLLARNPKDLDKEAIASFVGGKRVLITGAGGSIGSELARSVVGYGAAELTLVDSSEYNLYTIGEELASKYPTLSLVDVTDRDSLERLLAKTKPQIIIHAAAYKHVPMVEANQHEAVVNNILGTKNCIDLAISHSVETFVLISTDKAVRPTSVMGATKRVCELYLQSVSSMNTRLVAVRFGNVLGSSGSVVPRFHRLIAENKPLTVTHPNMTRYFMLTSEAVELVLQAASMANGGEIFVLDMGMPVRIADMAAQMLDLAGKSELGIVYTGLRPGEKLYEELLIEEGDQTTKYPSIFVGRPSAISIESLCYHIEEILTASNVPAALKSIVPEFNHNKGGDNAVNLSRV